MHDAPLAPKKPVANLIPNVDFEYHTQLKPPEKEKEKDMAPLTTFSAPIRTDGNAWDFHIYYRLEDQFDFAKALHERVKLEFPTAKVFRLWEKPIGPHTMPMFEVDVFTPAEFGAFLSWIALNRGDLSVLAHPHTTPGNDVEDHLVHGIWCGPQVPLIRAALEPHSPPQPSLAV